MKKHFIWLPEENKTICEIKDNNLVFTGTAFCHEHDQDFKSEITGGYIAESRADIKYYQHQKNNVIKPALKALNHLLNCLKQSKNYNENSPEVKVIKKHIYNKEEELRQVITMIKIIKQDIKMYVDSKEALYKKLRARAKQNK